MASRSLNKVANKRKAWYKAEADFVDAITEAKQDHTFEEIAEHAGHKTRQSLSQWHKART